jgi:hypothetical protein
VSGQHFQNGKEQSLSFGLAYFKEMGQLHFEPQLVVSDQDGR